MDKAVNIGLFTVPNIIAIGAIMLFWGMIAYSVNQSFAAQNAG